jgi:large subunit ribosomal protein L29
MKASELKELTTKELEEKIDNEVNFLIRQKINHAVSPLDNPQKIKVSRKNVARLKTEFTKRMLNQQTES